jgi:hypothetical protein
MTDKVTFQESAASDNKQPVQSRSLRDHLGPLGFTITLAAVVLAFLALGVGVSLLVKALRRPPIVTHGALGQVVLASTAPRQFNRKDS